MNQKTTSDVDLDSVRARYRAERDKRLDPTRRDVLDLSEHEDLLDDPFTERVEREPKDDDVDAVVVGAGFGGLLQAAQLRQLGLGRIRIVEKAGDVGGVWYWNRYPGVMCDVESYVYLPLLEELNYIPEHRYSYGPEIFAYTQKIAEHFDLYDDALFHTAVTGATWEPDIARWRVTTDRGDEFTARYIVVTHGSFSSLKFPDIEGIEDFEGKLFHSSRWDYEYTGGDTLSPLDKLGDKTVGIVGTGASAIQVVPAVAQTAEKLYVFQRTPSTVAPRNNAPTDPEWAKALEPGWQRRRRDNFTAITNGERAEEDLVADAWTVFFHAMLNSDRFEGLTPEEMAEQRELIDLQHMENVRARVDEIVEDPQVAETLKPYYRYQCKRPGFHDEYLPAFNRPNVELVDTQGKGVERITAKGVVIDGTEYELDLLVLATGFDQDSSYTDRVGFDVTGLNGQTLSQKWADGPETFHGVVSHGFPNFFFLPPNYTQGTAGVNFVHTLEESARHVTYIIGELEARGAVGNVTKEAEDAYVEFVVHGAGLALLGGRAFLEQCTPGRWNNEGDPGARQTKNVNYPGTSTAYFTAMEEWRQKSDLREFELTPIKALAPGA